MDTYLYIFQLYSGSTAIMIYMTSCVRLKSSLFFMKLKRLVSTEILQRWKMMAVFPAAEKGLQILITDLAVLTSVPVLLMCPVLAVTDNYLSWKAWAARMR